jgi:hypothetical protein
MLADSRLAVDEGGEMRLMKKLVVGAAMAGTLLTAAPAQATGTVVWEGRRARVTETLTEYTVCDLVNGQDYCYVVHDPAWKVQSKLGRDVNVLVKCTFTVHASERTSPTEQTLDFFFVVRKGQPRTTGWVRVDWTSDWSCSTRRLTRG